MDSYNELEEFIRKQPITTKDAIIISRLDTLAKVIAARATIVSENSGITTTNDYPYAFVKPKTRQKIINLLKSLENKDLIWAALRGLSESSITILTTISHDNFLRKNMHKTVDKYE